MEHTVERPEAQDGNEPKEIVYSLKIPVDETADVTKLREGQRIMANYKNKCTWYPGTISCDHGNDTYDILFDDGDVEKDVPVQRIHPLGFHWVTNVDSNICKKVIEPTPVPVVTKIESDRCDMAWRPERVQQRVADVMDQVNLAEAKVESMVVRMDKLNARFHALIDDLSVQVADVADTLMKSSVLNNSNIDTLAENLKKLETIAQENREGILELYETVQNLTNAVFDQPVAAQQENNSDESPPVSAESSSLDPSSLDEESKENLMEQIVLLKRDTVYEFFKINKKLDACLQTTRDSKKDILYFYFYTIVCCAAMFAAISARMF